MEILKQPWPWYVAGTLVAFHPKKFNKGQIIGGVIFGSAIAGTWVYGYFREKLPH